MQNNPLFTLYKLTVQFAYYVFTFSYILFSLQLYNKKGQFFKI